MKRWTISLVLVVALLLSAVLGVSAAATSPRFTTVSLTLNTSIAINFKVPYADINGNFTKAEFLKDGKVVQTISKMPTAGSDGYAAFAFTALSPRELGKDITARLYDASGAYTEVTTTVLKYCNRVLADTAASETLKRMVVDLLNYGAAYQIYKNDNVDNLANAGLTAEQNALATDFVSVDVNESYAQSSDVQNPAATWYGATLILNDSIMMNFWFQAAAGTDGLVAKVTLGDQTWEINKFTGSSGMYKIAFDQVNPSQMSEPVKVVICDASGNPVSNTLTYSIEDYVANTIASTSASDSLKALVKAMACYGKTGFSWQKETTEVITRADMEKALTEVAWTYYMLGYNYQYDSTALNSETKQHLNNPLCAYCGGKGRMTQDASPEDASSHQAAYTVCSGYCYDVYYEALSYAILGNKYNCLTMSLWRNTSSSLDNDMAVLRWHSGGAGNIYNVYDSVYDVQYASWKNATETVNFFHNYKTTMRPGDIIVYDTPGHAMLYIGNGIVLDANGGKYRIEDVHTDYQETNGTVDYNTFEDKYLNSAYTNYYIDSRVTNTKNSICVLRPLNLLTVDDGDNNPGNDLLDKSYVQDIGLMEFEVQYSADSQVGIEDYAYDHKTSGFTIDETTYTRMKYPTMNIDRTVNITPFGTAVQGDTLTYTVAISNNSNNPKYAAYQGAGYTGTAYNRLSVREVIPAGTELVSATGTYVLDGDVLRWTVDIQPGETLELSYTVKVTGAIGTEIVSGGGYVADIPTNTITNTIGGKKLSSTAALEKFFHDGPAAWNSNSGYAITASTTAGTRFAERIYNETTGLDLQLPDVQALWDLFFSKTKVVVSAGHYLYHNPSVTVLNPANNQYVQTGLENTDAVVRYMYQLKGAPTSAADKTVYDMLVTDFYGGVWAWSDELSGNVRINEIRDIYVEPGDILVGMNLKDIAATTVDDTGATVMDYSSSENRAVTGWRVVVCLGANKYASLTSGGVLERVTDAAVIQTLYGYDGFVCLRPSQAYADINQDVAAFSATQRPTLGTADTAAADTSGVNNALLSQTIIEKLAALDISNNTSLAPNTAFAGDIYSMIGIDIVTNGTADVSFANIMGNCFNGAGTDTDIKARYGYHYSLLATPKAGYENVYKMIQYYGGNAFTWKNVKQLRAMGELYPGDILMLGSRSNRFYVCAVYQGEGNFLVAVQDLKFNTVSGYYSLHFNTNAEFLKWFSGTINELAESVDVNNAFDPNAQAEVFIENYIVLRPTRLFGNFSGVATGRDMVTGVLTNGEMASLAALTTLDWSGSGSTNINLNNVPAWAYGIAGVDVSKYLNNYTMQNARDLIFKWGTDGKLTLLTTTDAAYNPTYRTMLVEGAYGGTSFATSKVFTQEDFRVGDIFCGCKGKTEFGLSGALYWVAIYQGNGQFLVVQNGGGVENQALVDISSIFSANIGTEWSYYYVLRPEQLAYRDISTGVLTATEMDRLAALTVNDWTTGGSKYNIKNAAPWLYARAGISVEKHIGTHTVATARDALFKYGTDDYLTLLATTDANYDPVYRTMLVNGAYGGTAFAASKTFAATDFQVGDLFCGCKGAAITGSSALYWVAMYQGNGQFLVIQNGGGGTTQAFVDSTTLFSTNIGTEWSYYYVLRPDRLAISTGNEGNSPVVLRTLTASGLTAEEKDAISALTANQWLTECQSKTLQKILPWAYEAVGVDLVNVAGYASLSVNGVKDLFVANADTTALGYDYYNSMLIEDSYGTSATGIGTSYYQVGDIFCGRQNVTLSNNTKKNLYYVAICQSETSFLVIYDKVNATNTAVEDGSEVMTADALNAMTFEYRYVLRPELMTLRKIVKNGTLSTAEEAAISALTTAKWQTECKSRTVQSVLPWAYKAAGIDVIGLADYSNASVATINSYIKAGASTAQAGYVYYNRILVDGSYKLNGTATDTLPTLQIGDVLCGYEPSTVAGKTLYYVAIYQGNGKFLSVYDQVNAAGTGHEAGCSNTLTQADLIAKTTSCRYVLRPKQLAGVATPRLITTGALTASERAAIVQLTPDDFWASGKGRNLNAVLPWVYTVAGVDVTGVTGYTSQSVANARTPMANNDGYYSVMLVAGSQSTANRTGTGVTGWQIGDIFCARSPKSTVVANKYQYYVAVYQGSNNFLVMYDTPNAAGTAMTAACAVMTLTELNALSYDYSYVLRPSQLAG